MKPKRPIPDLQVMKTDGTGWAKASLRDRRGQLYLQWREGKWVRSVYIGLSRSPARSRAGCHTPKRPKTQLEAQVAEFKLHTYAKAT
jgi:hypothetical protein